MYFLCHAPVTTFDGFHVSHNPSDLGSQSLYTLCTQSSCDDLTTLLSHEVRAPMEGMLRKITTLKSDMISLLNASPSFCGENKERERQEEEEEEGLFLSDFSPNSEDDSDRFKDRDRGCCIGGRGPGQRAKEAKCLGQLPLWATSLGGIKGQCESAIIRFNDISALKNLHSGKTELAAQTINPRQFFRDRFERFDSLLRKKNINFEMVSEGEYENVHVRADPRLLGKALESVFINAVDGTKEQNSIQVRMHDRSDRRKLCEQNVKCKNYLDVFFINGQIMMTRESRGTGKDGRRTSNMGNTLNLLQAWSSGVAGQNRVPFRKNSVYPRDAEEVLDALKVAEEDLYQGRQGDFVVIEINEKRTVTFSPFSPAAVPYPHITGPADLEAAVGVKSITRAQLGLGITFAKGRWYFFHMMKAKKYMDAEICGVGSGVICKGCHTDMGHFVL
jgi:hypothetical protein